MHDNHDDGKKEHLKKEDNNNKKRHDNLADDEKEQSRKYEKKGKKMPDNLDSEKNEHLKKRTTAEKKKNVITFMIMKKEDLRKYEKKGKKVMRDSPGDDERTSYKNDKKKIDKRLQTLDKRSSIFSKVQMCSITDSCITHNTSSQIN